MDNTFSKEKLCEIYNMSDYDALMYLKPFCIGNQLELVNRLISLNLKYIEGENITVEGTEDDYHNEKWKLFEQFGVMMNTQGEMEL